MTRSERLLQAIALMPASEKRAIDLLYAQLESAMPEEDAAASAIEAATAGETTEIGSVHESAVRDSADAQKVQP